MFFFLYTNMQFCVIIELAFTDEEEQPFSNISIIEFKRPGRTNYSDTENPIRQVKEYMDNIVEGRIKIKAGEVLNGTENICFFCYILFYKLFNQIYVK